MCCTPIPETALTQKIDLIPETKTGAILKMKFSHVRWLMTIYMYIELFAAIRLSFKVVNVYRNV